MAALEDDIPYIFVDKQLQNEQTNNLLIENSPFSNQLQKVSQ